MKQRKSGLAYKKHIDIELIITDAQTMKIKDVAIKHNCSIQHVYWVLRKANIDLRKQNVDVKHLAPTEEEIERFLAERR